MKYFYAVVYGEKGKPHDPSYVRFESQSARDYFVNEPGRTGPKQEPGDAYYREALRWSRKLAQMRWRRSRTSMYDEGLQAA